jgi:hypothetical protein
VVGLLAHHRTRYPPGKGIKNVHATFHQCDPEDNTGCNPKGENDPTI